MSAIPKLSAAVRRYLDAFDLAAVAVSADGKIAGTRNPVGARAAWWCKLTDARRLLEVARDDDGDVLTAARWLGIVATDHLAVLARVSEVTSPNLPRFEPNSGDLFASDGAEELGQAWRDGLLPDPALTVSEWADRHRVLSPRASAEPGRYRTDRTPYMRAIIDALSATPR